MDPPARFPGSRCVHAVCSATSCTSEVATPPPGPRRPRPWRSPSPRTTCLTIVSAHLDLASIECADGRFEDCAAHIAIAEKLNPETAHTWECNFLIARADLALARGDNVEALQLAEQAAALEDESWSAGVQGVTNARYLGDAQLGVGNANDAPTTYQQLIAKATAAQYACRLAEGHEGSAAAESALGNNQDAHEHLAAAKEIRERTRSQRLPRPAVDRLLATLEADTPRTPRRCGSTRTQRRATTSTKASRGPQRPPTDAYPNGGHVEPSA